MNNYELRTEYKLQPEVDTTHNMSAGMRRHFPACYDGQGRYIEPERPLPFWPCVIAGVIVWVIASVVL